MGMWLALLLLNCVTGFSRLSDFWVGKASWQFHSWLNETNMPDYAGWNSGEGLSLVTIQNGTWFLFSREVYWNQTSYCSFFNGNALLGTVVRKSIDQGRTWSPATKFLTPRENTPYECMGGDGGAFFDAAKGTWHYLYQCLDRHGVWNGCHMSLQALDPVAAPVSAWQQSNNPVIKSGSLWSRICASPSAQCRRIPQAYPSWLHIPDEEGTFDIFAMDAQRNFYISFHGFDGINGYRGVAKTADFVTYVAGESSQGVPEDAVFNPSQANSWRESWKGWSRGGGVVENGTAGWSVGGGAGAIYFEDPFYYLVVETADMNLACMSGQNWDVGLLRSPSLATAPWDSFPGNPIFYNDRLDNPSAACNLAYNKIFQDPRTGQLFLHHHRSSGNDAIDGVFFYKLVSDSGALQNGNLWKCNTDNWDTLPQPKGHPPTNLVVYRTIKLAPDHNCVMAFNCGDGGIACDQGQSVFQDVQLQQYYTVGQNVTFSGSLGVQTAPDSLRVQLFFLSSKFEILATSSVLARAATIPEFATFSLTAAFVGPWAPNAAVLRAQLYPLTAGVTYFAGSLSLS